MKKIHKVEFLYPGVLVSESSIEVVETTNPYEIKVPENAFAFKFFDVMEQEAKLEDGRVITHKETKRDDITYFPGGRIMTIEEVEKEVPDNRILISNIKNNSRDNKVIKTRMGNFQYYDKDKTIAI